MHAKTHALSSTSRPMFFGKISIYRCSVPGIGGNLKGSTFSHYEIEKDLFTLGEIVRP